MENKWRAKDGKLLEAGQRVVFDGQHYGYVYYSPEMGLMVSWVDGVDDSVIDDTFDLELMVIDADVAGKATHLSECKRMVVHVAGAGFLHFKAEYEIYGEVIGEDYVITSDDGWVIAQFPKEKVNFVFYAREGVEFS